MSLRKIVGLSGVAKNENYLAQTWGRRFGFWMILIAIWLPLQWTMEKHHQISTGDIYIANWLVWLFFVVETFSLLQLVNNKKHYILTNWMNPIIIILGFPTIWNHTVLVGIVRGLQLLIMLRLLLPWWDSCIQVLARNRLGTTLAIAILITTLWGVLIYFVDPSVKTPWDGIWWAWETITTVGYGDIIPSTLWSRLLGITLMLMGVLLVSILTANFSAYLIKKSGEKMDKEEDEILNIVRNLNARLLRIENQLEKLNQKEIV
jgi:voltage-gated potassium channel